MLLPTIKRKEAGFGGVGVLGLHSRRVSNFFRGKKGVGEGGEEVVTNTPLLPIVYTTMMAISTV
jgi:hypothetical protein